MSYNVSLSLSFFLSLSLSFSLSLSLSLFLSLSLYLSFIIISGHLQWASSGGLVGFERAVGEAVVLGVEIDKVQNELLGKQ